MKFIRFIARARRNEPPIQLFTYNENFTATKKSLRRMQPIQVVTPGSPNTGSGTSSGAGISGGAASAAANAIYGDHAALLTPLHDSSSLPLPWDFPSAGQLTLTPSRPSPCDASADASRESVLVDAPANTPASFSPPSFLPRVARNQEEQQQQQILNGASVRLSFADVALVPLGPADRIRDRWLQPLVAAAGETPKIIPPPTLQFISSVLRTWPRRMARDKQCLPPIIHQLQMTQPDVSVPLANCFNLVGMWLNRLPGSEVIVADTVQREMGRLSSDHDVPDIVALAEFQAYFIYCIAACFFPMAGFDLFDGATMITLHEMAFRTARNGLICEAEALPSKQHLSWESWIVAAAKRRTLLALSLFDIVYNEHRLVPTFVAKELQDVYVPESLPVWTASSREAWEREHVRYVALWPERGPVKVSEFWRPQRAVSAESRARIDRIDRWVEVADEFGMMLFSVCVHVHGY
ncbi:C6 finger domain protein [Niveomyces insectorum RCEF 264]|uniref:C6 finger domain protein n=1 Tax=Niveomyces insectorum RCEF 264 TaxID=1081102 RepID=A0A167N9C0_9HYPO|nr:C6 finger domain protein [Niveomyces insectorum RCEF 264]